MTESEHSPKYPFDSFLSYAKRLDDVLHLSIEGLLRSSSSVPLAKALANLPPHLKEAISDEEPDPERNSQSVERAETVAKLAQQEIDTGFSLLHSQAVVSLWGALEAMVKDLAIARLQLEEELLANQYFTRIRIPLADFYRLGERDRLDLLIRETSRDKRSDFMPGIAKFESILEEVGLAGTVEEATKDQLYEMSKVRNVLVHRAGVVDRKLLDECPWLDYEVGDQIRIDHDKYSAYSNAVQEYVLALINRIRVVRDIPEYVPPPEDSRSEP